MDKKIYYVQDIIQSQKNMADVIARINFEDIMLNEIKQPHTKNKTNTVKSWLVEFRDKKQKSG